MILKTNDSAHDAASTCLDCDNRGGIVDKSTIVNIDWLHTYPNTARHIKYSASSTKKVAKYRAALRSIRLDTINSPSICLRAALSPSRSVAAPDRRASGKDGHFIHEVHRSGVGPGRGTRAKVRFLRPLHFIPIAARSCPNSVPAAMFGAGYSSTVWPAPFPIHEVTT